LQEREKTKTKRKEKRLQLKNKVLKDLENIGIWKDKNTIEENLAKFRTKKRKIGSIEIADQYGKRGRNYNSNKPEFNTI
jgi:hypothetical protein